MKEHDYLLVNNLVIIRAMHDLLGRFVLHESDGTDLYPFITADLQAVNTTLSELETALQQKVGKLEQ